MILKLITWNLSNSKHTNRVTKILLQLYLELSLSAIYSVQAKTSTSMYIEKSQLHDSTSCIPLRGYMHITEFLSTFVQNNVEEMFQGTNAEVYLFNRLFRELIRFIGTFITCHLRLFFLCNFIFIHPEGSTCGHLR
ncbi:hypothetical protein TorRG33x02_151620 [Trema orientale]|uniref:Uncharacterized protein n=1 Tax=Trema orientale TaxID=63057 RepID=A0A2P5EU86_TREOI|nr:hypothetical protein TorRG33x02_151620 [Trema orientale]